jgi:hypothetical protein
LLEKQNHISAVIRRDYLDAAIEALGIAHDRAATTQHLYVVQPRNL